MFSKQLVENLENQLYQIFSSFRWLGGEYWLLGGIILILLLEITPTSRSKYVGISLGIIFLLASFFQFVFSFQSITIKGKYLFGEMLFLMPQTYILKMIFVWIGIFTLLFLLYSNLSKEKKFPFSEWVVFLLSIELGLCFLSMSQNLLMIYLSLELISLVSYILVALPFKKEHAEATIKYFLFGAFTTGISLYGMSILYGLTGSLDLSTHIIAQNFEVVQSPIWLVAFFLMSGGLFFKISSLPFHFWTPDVYEASDSPLVAFLSTAPKIAGGWILMIFSSFVPAFWFPTWQMILAFLAIFTMTLGNVGAFKQTNIKRMLAYSSIAHAGFLIIPAIVIGNWSVTAFIYYSIVYSIANIGAFWLAENHFQKQNTNNMESLAGLGKFNILYGIFWIIFLITLNGLPPTSGFIAKLFLFSALWESYLTHQSFMLLTLFVIGILNTALGLVYYLKIPYLMFLKSEKETILIPFQKTWNIILVILIFILFFGINNFIEL
jgi:NADH-quinone oxidoreductase subunit N